MNFYQFLQLMEAGVAYDKYGYCPECSKQRGYRPQKLNPWQTKVQKCRYCGSGLYEKGDVEDNLADALRTEIEAMEKDPDVIKGIEIQNELISNPADEIYAKYGGEAVVDRLIDKAVLLGIKQKKLERISHG